MTAARADAERARLIRLVHVAKRDLAMDDGDYRALLARIGKAESSADLGIPALRKVLEHMKRAGFQVRPKAPGGRAKAADGQSRKIRALWLDLHGRGAVRDPSEAALGAFVRRMTGVEALQWLDSAKSSKVIEELKKWRNRL